MSATRRQSSLDRILGRVDDLDSTNLAILVQRLARERSLLESVFNVIQEGILVIDTEGRIDYANASAERLLGIRKQDVGQTVLWKLVPDLARSLNLGSLSHSASDRIVTREVQITYPEPRDVRLYVVAVETAGATTEQFALILSDITEERLSTEELIEKEKLTSIFMLAAGVAHEIGNPLNSINIHLQLAQRQIDKLSSGTAKIKLQQAVEVCTSEVERLDGIVRNFLNAIRPSPPDLQELDLIEVLTEVLDFQQCELTDLGIQVELALKETIPVVNGDRNQIKQVFFNVIKNAMEAMDAGGNLRISARSDEQFVFLYIADSGVGIAQEDLSRLFHPFESTKSNGHGLGMLIVQRIMRDHGGQIGIDSKPGTGTVVTLQFPQRHRRFRLLEQQ